MSQCTDQPVDNVGVDLSEDKWGVVHQVCESLADGLNRGGAAAEHTCRDGYVSLPKPGHEPPETA